MVVIALQLAGADVNSKRVRKSFERSQPPGPKYLDRSLVREAAFLGGRWIDHSIEPRIAVHDPASGNLVGEVPNLSDGDVDVALTASVRCFAGWRTMLPQERGILLNKWAALVRSRAASLASIITAEQGKPLCEATAEVEYGASFLAWYAEEASRIYGETIPSHLPGAYLVVSREPVGPAAAITPWNFPLAMIARKAGAALSAGCPVLAMPSSLTPFSTLALAALASEAGLPDGVFQVLTGDAQRIGTTLASDPRVQAVSFTGSTAVGRRIASLAGSTVKRVSLELGGHAPFILLDDADIDRAIAAAMAAKYATSGQDCLAVNRFFVLPTLYDQFCDALAAATSRLIVGSGFDAQSEIGPLIGAQALAKCLDQVADARRKGARILIGGDRHPAGENFIMPTVIADVTDDMIIASEETFGPIAAVTNVANERDAIAKANASPYGLAAYVFGSDIGRVLNAARSLDYGMVGVNTPRFTGPPIPFGGFRQSGLGREGGRHGIEAFSDIKYICIGGLDPAH